MGTPEFAVPSLEALARNSFNIVLVVTQPDKPKGRGRKIASPPVKNTALDLGYEVFQPASIKDNTCADVLASYSPDLFVVIAYGHILPENVLSIPGTGAVNIHASLLPRYRGPAPIQWAIINREKKTGVTSMFMDSGMDTGDILIKRKTDITPQETAQSLHDRLAVIGAEVLIDTLEGIENRTISTTPQEHQNATYAPMLTKNDGRIDWKKSAEEIDAFIRGMNPWPGAFTFYNEMRLKIFMAEPMPDETQKKPGEVIKWFSGELCVATGQGSLSILEIQSSSGKRLDIKDFLKGHVIPVGTQLK